MSLQEDLIARADHLKVVSRYGVGFDNIDVGALTRRGIPLAVVGQDNAVSVAEHTMYLIFAAAKMGQTYDRAVRNGDWQYRDSLAATELSGKRVFIIGMGRIGRKVAALAQAFGMRISFHDPAPRATDLGADWVRVHDLAEGLRDADVVTLHVPLTESTMSLIGGPELAMMKPSAILVSTSRGGVVDEAALASALSGGGLRAAGLDVFVDEPVQTSNPLLALGNVVLSPHMAALSYECAERMSLTAAKNCLDGVAGCLDAALVVNNEVLVRR